MKSLTVAPMAGPASGFMVPPHLWLGAGRQLQHNLDRVVIFGRGEIDVGDCVQASAIGAHACQASGQLGFEGAVRAGCQRNLGQHRYGGFERDRRTLDRCALRALNPHDDYDMFQFSAL